MDHLDVNSTTAVADGGWVGGFIPPSAATLVVEFMAKWLNLYPHMVVKRRKASIEKFAVKNLIDEENETK